MLRGSGSTSAQLPSVYSQTTDMEQCRLLLTVAVIGMVRGIEMAPQLLLILLP